MTTSATPSHGQLHSFRPLLLGIFGVLVVSSRFVVSSFQQGHGFSLPLPFEDAAMLFRYAENLASGYGIVWNDGQLPGESDGATDLGFVLVLAPLIKLGFSPPMAGLLVNGLGLFAIGFFIGIANRDRWLLPAPVPFLIVGLVSLSVWSPIAGGFSSSAFGAILLLVLLATQWALRHPRTSRLFRSHFLLVGVLAGLAGWWRPEGFLLAPFVVLLSICTPRAFQIVKREKSLLPLAASSGIAFGILATAWVIFRLTHFGFLMPTAGTNKLESVYWTVVNSVRNLESVGLYYLVALLPILTVAVALAIRTARARAVLAPLAAIGAAALLWTPFDLTFNWWGRIWWPLVPVLVAWTITFLTDIYKAPESNARPVLSTLQSLTLVASGIGILIVYPAPSTGEWPPEYERLPFHTLMYETLRPLNTSSLRVATTEAGLVPLSVNEGAALDTWVHNTRSIAENGIRALPSELDSFVPNMIVVHGPTPTEFIGGEACTQFDPDWTTQARILYAYAMDNNFSLVRVDQTGPCDTWSIFASSNAPAKIVTAIDEAIPWATRIY